jgi:chromosome partitioning protein
MHTIEAANAAADFVLIPARPSPHDLRAVAVVVEMVEQAKKPFCFVVNGATPRTNIAKEAVGALAELGTRAGIAFRPGNCAIMEIRINAVT